LHHGTEATRGHGQRHDAALGCQAIFADVEQVDAVCVFWLKLDKVSRRNWTRIPFEPGHGFWLKLDKDSSANWTHQIARG
jgi:hypothetical protein